MREKLLSSYWFKSGSISLFTTVSSMALNYLNFFLLVRILNKDDFGVWVIFLSILRLSESIRKAFTYNPLLRYLNSESKENHQKIINASLALNLSLAVLIVIVFLFLGGIINHFSQGSLIKPMLNISILAVFAYSFSAHFSFLQQAALRFFGTLFSSVVQSLILSAFLIIVLLKGFEVSVIIITQIYVLSYLVSMIILFGFTPNRGKSVSFNVQSKWLWELFHYGKFTFGTNLSSMVNKSSKEWFLGGIIGPAAVATFAPALRIVNLFEIPLNALASVYYPKVINQAREGGESMAKYMYEKSVGVIVIGLLPIVLIIFFFAEPIILVLAGSDYLDSVAILQILAFIGILGPFLRQFGVTLNAIGRAHINFYFMITTSFGGILISLIGIAAFGIIGAAYGTLITYALSAIAAQHILKREIGVNTMNVFKFGFQGISQGIRLILPVYNK